MKKIILIVLALALTNISKAQIEYSANLTTGLGMTYKSNFLPKYGVDFNFELNNGLLFGLGLHFGNNSFGLASNTPDIVEKNRTLQFNVGFVQHTSKKVSIQTYVGIATIRNVDVSSQEDNAHYLKWLAENTLSNNKEEYEPSYLTTTYKDIGVPIGINFIFREKNFGWHFGYYAVAARRHEIGFKLGLTFGSRK